MRQFRLVHIGFAAAMIAATCTAIGVVREVDAASGRSSVFVPITPCRLIDTRAGSDSVGIRATPISSGEAATFQVSGSNGNCFIPASATGIATNATATNPTASSYVTIYPADADPRPTASNLNFVAGAAPTPNQVTVGLSAAGAIGVYNLAGTVDLIVDIVGYYEAASAGGVTGVLVNDDRYYTKAQVDATIAGVNAAIATKDTRATGSRVLVVSPVGFVPANAGVGFNQSNSFIYPVTSPTTVCAVKDIFLPDGVTVTKLSAYVLDSDSTNGAAVFVSLQAQRFGTVQDLALAAVDSTDQDNALARTISKSPTDNAVVNDQTTGYSLTYCGRSSSTTLYDVSITYTLP